MVMILMPCLPADSKSQGRHAAPMPWKSYGAGARLVRAGARGHDAVALQRREGEVDVLARVDGAQAGEDVQRVLRDAHAVVLEADRLLLGVVAADGAGTSP
jgi:hypothetical protein